MMNLYELEQHILGCWNVCDDIETLEEQGASMADMTALSTLYKYKFQKLWDVYETLLQQRSLERALTERQRCPRCDKVMSGDGVGIHSCTPKEGWLDAEEKW